MSLALAVVAKNIRSAAARSNPKIVNCAFGGATSFYEHLDPNKSHQRFENVEPRATPRSRLNFIKNLLFDKQTSKPSCSRSRNTARFSELAVPENRVCEDKVQCVDIPLRSKNVPEFNLHVFIQVLYIISSIKVSNCLLL